MWLRFLRNLDLLVLAVALAVFLVAHFPIAGWLTAAGGWLLQRLIRALVTRRAERSRDPRTTVGLMAGSMIARGWLVAGLILGVGLSNHHAGLAAAVLFLVIFTVQFSTSLILRPFEQDPRQ